MSEADPRVSAANAATPHDNLSTASTANSITSHTNRTAPQSNAAAPAIAPDGTVVATNPNRGLNPTTAPQDAFNFAGGDGGASTHPLHLAEESWRAGFCEADDMGTCVRYATKPLHSSSVSHAC